MTNSARQPAMTPAGPGDAHAASAVVIGSKLYTMLFTRLFRSLLRKWFRKLFGSVCVAAVSVTLLACQPVKRSGEDSPYNSVPAGSTLQLHQALTIPRHQVAVYLQDGKVLRYRDVNKYQPNCKFEIYTISDQERQVSPGVFRIQRVVDDIETAAVMDGAQLASMQLSYMFDHSVVFNYATMMFLESDQQPDVYRMTCQHWEDIREDEYLSVAQMRQAMGEVFSLTLKQP